MGFQYGNCPMSLAAQVKEMSADNCPMPGSGERPKQVRPCQEFKIYARFTRDLLNSSRAASQGFVQGEGFPKETTDKLMSFC